MLPPWRQRSSLVEGPVRYAAVWSMEGGRFDLPVAVGILLGSSQLPGSRGITSCMGNRRSVVLQWHWLEARSTRGRHALPPRQQAACLSGKLDDHQADANSRRGAQLPRSQLYALYGYYFRSLLPKEMES